jgi:hypothetical protein
MEARVNWLQDPLPVPPGRSAARSQNLVTVEIKSGSVPAAVTSDMMAGDVGHVIRGLADELDVTVTISGFIPPPGRS